MEFHEIASIFPLMTGEDYRALRDDIAENGLIERIIVHEEKILDGRNRYTACLEVGIVPGYDTFYGDDALAFVVSKNLHRRHLDTAQRGVIANELANMAQGERTDIEPSALLQKVSQSDAADMMGVSSRTLADVRVIERDAPELVPQMKSGELTIPQAKKRLKNPALYSSESNEWYTPSEIIDRVISTLGAIDLDPCSNEGEPNIPALNHFTQVDDGLSLDWFGNVYMNPPYGNEIDKWIYKVIDEYQSGRVKNALLLVPSRTDTRWFRSLKDYPRCFIWGRLSFSGSKNKATFPSMVVYLGNGIENFILNFQDIGDIYRFVGNI